MKSPSRRRRRFLPHCAGLFFDARPVVLEPGFYQFVVALFGLNRRDLCTPPQRLETSGEVMGMVRHAELTENHPTNAIECPPVGIESRFEGSELKQLQKLLPLLVGQTRRPPGPRAVPKSRQTCGTLAEALCQLPDGSPTDTQVTSDFCLRESAFEEEPSGFHAPFFKLSLGQNTWSPHARSV